MYGLIALYGRALVAELTRQYGNGDALCILFAGYFVDIMLKVFYPWALRLFNDTCRDTEILAARILAEVDLDPFNSLGYSRFVLPWCFLQNKTPHNITDRGSLTKSGVFFNTLSYWLVFR